MGQNQPQEQSPEQIHISLHSHPRSSRQNKPRPELQAVCQQPCDYLVAYFTSVNKVILKTNVQAYCPTALGDQNPVPMNKQKVLQLSKVLYFKKTTILLSLLCM